MKSNKIYCVLLPGKQKKNNNIIVTDYFFFKLWFCASIFYMAVPYCEEKNAFRLIHLYQIKVSTSRNKIGEPELLPKNKRTNLFLSLMTQKYLKLDFRFPVFPSRQDRKTNLLVYLLGEVTA